MHGRFVRALCAFVVCVRVVYVCVRACLRASEYVSVWRVVELHNFSLLSLKLNYTKNHKYLANQLNHYFNKTVYLMGITVFQINNTMLKTHAT